MTAENVTPIPKRRRRVDGFAPEQPEHLPPVPWETPTPLVDVERPPAFPLEVIPEPVRSYVQYTAETLNMGNDPALLAALVLPVVSSITAGRWIVRVRNGWEREPLQMFLASIALPSVGKSPALNAMAGPVRAIERELIDAYALEHERIESDHAIDRKRRQEYENRLAKDSNDTKARRELDDLLHNAAKPPPPVPQFIAGDTTAEGLNELMAATGGRAAQLDDEPGVLGMMAGRYLKNGSLQNLDPWLKGYSGNEPIIVNRAQRSVVRIDRPTLTLAIGVQPAALRAAGRDLDQTGRGIMARFLYTWPQLDVWDRSTEPPEVSASLVEQYAARLRKLHQVGAGTPIADPKVLTVDADALQVLREWFHQTANLRRASSDEGTMLEWLGKLDGQTVRIAGNLTLLDDPTATSIPLQHAEAAVRLARDYFLPHAQRVFVDLVQTDQSRRAVACLDAIRNGHGRGWERWPHQVKAAEVRQAVRGQRRLGLDEIANVEEALALLADRDYLRLATPPAGEPRQVGRPVKWYEVNPAALEHTHAGNDSTADDLILW